MRPLKYGIGIRPGLTISQVSARQATEFSPARRPIVSPGYICQSLARWRKAWRWSGWNSWKPTTEIWCWPRTSNAPLSRCGPDPIRALCPPLLVWELPSRLKLAMLKVTTGGSAIGGGREAAGLTSTAARSSRGVILPLYFEVALGMADADALGVGLTPGSTLAFASAPLSESGLRSPRNQRKPTPHTATSSTTKAAMPNFSRTSKR